MMTMMMMTQFNRAETRMGMSLATAASPQPFFRVPWRMGDAVVGRGNAGLTTLKEWTSLPMPELLTRVSCRKDWKRISAESSLMSLRRFNRSRDWTELNCPHTCNGWWYVSLNIKNESNGSALQVYPWDNWEPHISLPTHRVHLSAAGYRGRRSEGPLCYGSRCERALRERETKTCLGR